MLWRQPEDFVINQNGDILEVQNAPGVWTRYIIAFGEPNMTAIFKADTSPLLKTPEVPLVDVAW